MAVPPELYGRIKLGYRDLFLDSDPFTRTIYDLGDSVVKVQSTGIARTFVDMNRSEDQMPPENPDGLIKSTTCHRKTVYFPKMEPDESMRRALIMRHYRPYHQAIADAMMSMDAAVGIDCHSMAARAPSISPEGPRRRRPEFCISNCDSRSASFDLAYALAICIAEAFGIPDEKVLVNSPFRGGCITEKHGSKIFPWLQVDMNRSLYMSEPWFDRDTLACSRERLLELNAMFLQALTRFAERNF